ncbi:MAG: alpha/beta hydrolase [Ilumatobacter sp.]
METETIEFETADGLTLTADLCVPTNVRAAAIVCHPHPQYGGNRFNPVVEALFSALPGAGIAALRFDFRSVFAGGIGERLDAEAALAALRQRVLDVPTIATGYSFGAMVTLALDDDRIVAKVLVAPPLGHMDTTPGHAVPTLVLSPAHDQFAPPDVAEPVVATWPLGEFKPIESVDHFLVGRAGLAAALSADWLEQRLDNAHPLR